MYAGIIHRRSNDGTWTWGQNRKITSRADIPRSWVLRNQIFYCTSAITTDQWAEILGPEDEIFGMKPGKFTGVKIRITSPNGNNAGSYKIFHPSIWNISDRESRLPSVLDHALSIKMTDFAAAGVERISTSLAQTALAMYASKYDGRIIDGIDYPQMKQLPPRWRMIAHASMHGGPIACLRGGSQNAVEVDLKSAYLYALDKPIPVIGRDSAMNPEGYFTYKNGKWKEIRKGDGFVEATVSVNTNIKYGLPPLPLNTPTGIQYPIGTFRGAWAIPLLKQAEEFGEVQIKKIHSFALAKRMMNLFHELTKDFENLPTPIAKQLYTKFWGKFAFKGGFSGTVSPEPIIGQVPKNGFWWRDDQITQTGMADTPFYRPDIAAYVSAYNHMNVAKALRQLDPQSIIAVHVDAIWTEDISGAHRLAGNSLPDPVTKIAPVTPKGDWVLKRQGPLRFWGCGIYNHNGKLGYSGYDQKIHGRASVKRIENWIASNRERVNLRRNRDWVDGIDPTQTQDAVSTAIKLELPDSTDILEGINMYSTSWSRSGWPRRKNEDENG